MEMKDREKALEERYFREENLSFEINVRSYKLLGLWAAKKMELSAQDMEKYAKSVVQAGLVDNNSVKKVLCDFKNATLNVTENSINEEQEKLLAEARIQIESEYLS